MSSLYDRLLKFFSFIRRSFRSPKKAVFLQLSVVYLDHMISDLRHSRLLQLPFSIPESTVNFLQHHQTNLPTAFTRLWLLPILLIIASGATCAYPHVLAHKEKAFLSRGRVTSNQLLQINSHQPFSRRSSAAHVLLAWLAADVIHH